MEDFICYECKYFDSYYDICTFQRREISVSPGDDACGDFELDKVEVVL